MKSELIKAAELSLEVYSDVGPRVHLGHLTYLANEENRTLWISIRGSDDILDWIMDSIS